MKKCVADEDYQGAADAKAEIAALTCARHGSRSATGLAAPSAIGAMGAASMRVEEVDEEEDKRQAELGRAKDHSTKCLAEEDYQGVADAQARIIALTSVGHGSRPATGHAAASALGSRGANAMPDEEVEEEEEKRQAELRHVQKQLNKYIADEDYSAAAALQRHFTALQSVESCSRRDHGWSRAGRSAATATGHGSVPATGRTVPNFGFSQGCTFQAF